MLRLLGAAALALAAAQPALSQGRSDANPGKNGGGKPDQTAVDRGRGADKAGDNGRAQAIQERIGRPERVAREQKAERRSPQPERLIERAVTSRVDDDRSRDASRTLVRDDRRYGGDGWVERDRFYDDVPNCPPGLAKKNNGCLPPGLARQARNETFGYSYRPALFGIPLPATADYVYYDGYLIQPGGGGGFLPLLGGALAVGQLWPEAYPSLRLSDRQLDYYGFDDPNGYRYADNVLYRVDPSTSAIEAIAALFTGNDFAVGQRIPQGYDVYNVPADYRDEYSDNDDSMYRYADGQILQVDPTTMLIEQIIELIA